MGWLSFALFRVVDAAFPGAGVAAEVSFAVWDVAEATAALAAEDAGAADVIAAKEAIQNAYKTGQDLTLTNKEGKPVRVMMLVNAGIRT
eukprot:gene8058-1292_t